MRHYRAAGHVGTRQRPKLNTKDPMAPERNEGTI